MKIKYHWKCIAIFFENEIEPKTIEVELSNNDVLLIKNRAPHVAHIMELHEFYDKALKHKISGLFFYYSRLFKYEKRSYHT